MMKRNSRLPLVLLLWQLVLPVYVDAATAMEVKDAPPRATFRGDHEIQDDRAAWQKTGKLRRVQADTFFPPDDPYWNPAGIMERKPCIPFDMIRSGKCY